MLYMVQGADAKLNPCVNEVDLGVESRSEMTKKDSLRDSAVDRERTPGIQGGSSWVGSRGLSSAHADVCVRVCACARVCACCESGLDNPHVSCRNTKTYIWDVTDLDNPVLMNTYYSAITVIDHNQYIVGNLTYQSNYRVSHPGAGTQGAGVVGRGARG